MVQAFRKVLVMILCAFAGAAAAQTVTVAKSGTAEFSTVQAAIDSFIGDFNSVPNVIQITDSSVYGESIANWGIELTIVGTGASRPILATQVNPGGANVGVDIYLLDSQQQSFMLKNLIIIPSLTAPPATGVQISGTSATVELDNILITANDGNDAPVSVDGLTLADTTATVYFSHRGLYMNGTYFTGTLKKTVITHVLNNPAANAQDGFAMGLGAFADYKILDGCVFSFCSRLGIYGGGGNFEIDAPTTRCVISNNRGFAGLWFASGQRRSINGAIIANNTGFGIEHQNASAYGLTISNSIIANNGNINLKVSEVGTSADIRLTSVTIGVSSNPAASPINVHPLSSADIYLTDCIIAGNGSTDGRNTVMHSGTGTMTLTGTALVTDGPNALHTATAGAGLVNGAPSVTADPQFINVSDVISKDYFDVANPVYGIANSVGSPLGGGADFVGESSVRDWSVY